MALRHNHYDAAFEAYLRGRRVPYIAVDEAKRSLLASASLKSMDFLVSIAGGENLLVDVKGRRYPTTEAGNRWENWVTAEDVQSLLCWEETFGGNCRSLFVFAYDVAASHEGEFETLFEFRRKRYAFFAVGAGDYQAVMRPRSRRWQTVFVGRRRFAALRSPIDEVLQFRQPSKPPATGRQTEPAAGQPGGSRVC